MSDDENEAHDFYSIPHFNQRRQKKLSTRKFVIIMTVAIGTILAFGIVLIIIISKREPESTHSNNSDISPPVQVVAPPIEDQIDRLVIDRDFSKMAVTGKMSNFDIGDEIMKCGLAKIYMSKKLSDNSSVLVKVYEDSTKGVQQFNFEWRTLYFLKNHPYIIHLQNSLIVCSDESEAAGFEGKHILVLEHPQKGSMLSHRLEKAPLVRKWFAQLVSVLEYIRSLRIIHQRLEAANVFIDLNDNIRVANFETAIIFDQVGEQTDNTAVNIYSSPERILMEPITYLSDIFSLGILFYHFYGENPLPEINQNLDPAVKKTEMLKRAMNAQNWPLKKDVTWKEKDLYRQMTEPCDQKRINIAGIKAHPYFHGVEWAQTPHPL